MDELIVFNPLYQDDEIESCFNMYNELINGNLKNSNKFVSLLIKLAEKYNLYDNLFNSLLTYLLINNENSFTLALERKKPISSNLKAVVMNDFKIIFNMFNTNFEMLEPLQRNLINSFTPSKPVINQELFEVSTTLQENLTKCNNVDDFYTILEKFFLTYGVGKFGLNKAFRYENKKIVPIIHIGIVTAITNVARTLLKNTKSTITANKPPTIILDFTNAIACKI